MRMPSERSDDENAGILSKRRDCTALDLRDTVFHSSQKDDYDRKAFAPG